MSLALLFHYLLLNMFRKLVHPSSGSCDLLWIYFMCCIALVRCVLVLRCGSAGVEWYPYAGWSTSAYSTNIYIVSHISFADKKSWVRLTQEITRSFFFCSLTNILPHMIIVNGMKLKAKTNWISIYFCLILIQ